jgi:TolB-like protein
VARRYADAFTAEGLTVWWDHHLRSGEAFDEAIEAALKAAKVVVVLWSPRSVVSRWVRAEATLADRNKTLVPVTIEACERPIMFELTQTSDMSRWSGDAADGTWQVLLSDVRRLVGRELEAATPLPVAPSPEPAKPGERGEAPSLAVLPFTNRSGLPEDEVFAIGMVEDLIDALSQGVNVRVLSSASTARFCTGAMPDLEAMGRQLAVRYFLEGNVRRSGPDLRVTAQLVEAAGGAILWTRKFERPLAELAELQEELVVELAANLGAQVHTFEMARALKKPDDLTAWEAVNRAFATFRQIDRDSLERGVAEAAKAVAIAPDYGIAHAMLADTTSLRYFHLILDDPAEVLCITQSIERALAIDPENPAVLTYVAQAFNFSGRPDEAMPHVTRALRTSPGFGYAHFVCACSCLMLGRFEEALQHLDDDKKWSPVSPLEFANSMMRAWAHLGAEQWDMALAALDETSSFGNPSINPHYPRALVLNRLGNDAEALESMRRGRQAQPTASLDRMEMQIGRMLLKYVALNDLLADFRRLWTKMEAVT